MSDKDQARQEIEKIIQRLQTIPEKDRAKFNEAQTRHSFILPLFRALGWDTENPMEMSAEEQISRGFVDFGFYLNSVPAFYLETKKLHTDLEKEQWAKQAINYSWLRGVTWAALTDFEGMKVFNAEWQERDPQKALFLDLTWEKYTAEQFDDLWLLSKPAMLNGDINRVAERYGKKIKRKPVSELLFGQMTVWRRDLFKEMRTYGNLFKENTRLVDDAVQRFLDRLIFIRTVEDRGVELPRLQAVVRQYKESRKKDKNLFQELVKLFHELDSIYNAQLFSQNTLDILEIYDWSLLETIINGLYTDEKAYLRYDFSAINADVLGAVYEQYLSFKALDPTGDEALDPYKQTKRKSQGIFYTPQFVVRYIVQQTLGKLLAEGADPYKIRVLDPACGSGSFLIEAFDVLDRHLAQHGTEDDKQHPRKRRLRILQNNLYGVDLDPQAVEVARLNLLLRAASERGLLPMLHNIRVGNSLIDADEIVGESAFDWSTQFPEMMKEGGFDVIIGNPPYIRIQNLPRHETKWINENYVTPSGNYDIYIPFVERGLSLLNPKGVLGYILPHKFFTASYGLKLRGVIAEGKHLAEIVHFGEQQVFESASTYTCIMMLSKSPQTRFEFRKVRNIEGWIGGNGSIVGDIDADQVTAKTWNFEVGGIFNLFKRLEAMPVKLGEIARIFVGTFTGANDVFVLSNCQYQDGIVTGYSKALAETVTIEANLTQPFLLGRDIKGYETLTPTHALIFPYTLRQDNFELVSETDLAMTWPKTYDYLLRNRQMLEERAVEVEWYAYAGHRSMTLFQKAKLIAPDYNNSPSLTFDSQGFYFQTGYGVLPQEHVSPLYLLSLLNSKLLFRYLTHISTALRGGYVRFWTSYLKDIPIILPSDKTVETQLVQMADRMLQLKKEYAEAEIKLSDKRHLLNRQIQQLNQQIDGEVYNLYGLSAEEIALVEGK